MSKISEQQVKFDEWQIMKEQVDAFRQDLVDAGHIKSSDRNGVFAIGSPRNFTVVVIRKIKRQRFRITFRRDIRSGSHHFWWNQYAAGRQEPIEI